MAAGRPKIRYLLTLTDASGAAITTVEDIDTAAGKLGFNTAYLHRRMSETGGRFYSKNLKALVSMWPTNQLFGTFEFKAAGEPVQILRCPEVMSKVPLTEQDLSTLKRTGHINVAFNGKLYSVAVANADA